MNRLPLMPVLTVTCLIAANLAFAQTPNGTMLPGSNSKEPIDIAADKLDYFDKEQKAIYTGNVVVVQGETRLNASVLTIQFEDKSNKPKASEQESSSKIRSIEGKGPITITNKDQVGVGDSLDYDKMKNTFSLVGNVTLSQGENVTKGDKLVYDLENGKAVVSAKKRVLTKIAPGKDQPPAAKNAHQKH